MNDNNNNKKEFDWHRARLYRPKERSLYETIQGLRDRQRDRQTETEKETDIQRQIDRQTDRRTGSQADQEG